jgi:hypothetical protein
VRLRCGIVLAGLLLGACAGAPGGDATVSAAAGSGSPAADRPDGARSGGGGKLLQGEVVAVDADRGTIELMVYLAGAAIPRPVHEPAVLSVDGRTRFLPGGAAADLRPGDQVLVRAGGEGAARRAVEVTIIDLD